jgi:hypothetical protein
MNGFELCYRGSTVGIKPHEGVATQHLQFETVERDFHVLAQSQAL